MFKYFTIAGILASMLVPSSVITFPYDWLGHILAFILLGLAIKNWYILIPATFAIELIQPIFSRSFAWEDIGCNFIGLIVYYIISLLKQSTNDR